MVQHFPFDPKDGPQIIGNNEEKLPKIVDSIGNNPINHAESCNYSDEYIHSMQALLIKTGIIQANTPTRWIDKYLEPYPVIDDSDMIRKERDFYDYCANTQLSKIIETFDPNKEALRILLSEFVKVKSNWNEKYDLASDKEPVSG